MKKLLLVMYLFLLGTLSFAQTEGKPEWTVPIQTPCDWMTQTSTGHIIVGTKLSLLCIDPVTKQKIWETKSLNPVKQEDFTEIEGTPFATYESFNPLQSLRVQTTIIDFTTGKVIFNTKEDDIKLLNKTPMFAIEGMLLEVREGKKYYVQFLNVLDGEIKWSTEISGDSYAKGVGSIVKAIKAAFNPEATLDYEGNILFPDSKILKRFDAKTGKVLWEAEFEKIVKRVVFSTDGKVVFVGSGRKNMGLNLADGKEMWDKPYKMNGDFEGFVPKSENELYLFSSAELTVINTKTGKSVWKKPYEFKAGNYRKHTFTKDGILILTDDLNMSGNPKSSQIHYVTTSGKPIWKKPFVENAPIAGFRITPKGLLYASENEANLVDMKTAKELWKKRIKISKSPVYSFKDDYAYIYSNGSLYEIDQKSGQYKLIIEDIKMKGGNTEDINNIEVINNGILLTSSQNMVLVSKDGKIVYQKYYKAPSLGGTAGKIIAFAARVAVTYNELEVTQEVQVDAQGNATIVNDIHVSERGLQVTRGIKDLVANRKSTFTTQDTKYILTFVEEGDRKYIGMVKVDKNTGEEKGNILLRTLDPVYVIDEVAGKLYSTFSGSGTVSLMIGCFGL